MIAGEERAAALSSEGAALQEQPSGALGTLSGAQREAAALRDELGAMGAVP